MLNAAFYIIAIMYSVYCFWQAGNLAQENQQVARDQPTAAADTPKYNNAAYAV